MVDSLPENILIDSLEALESGQSIRSVLETYPESAELLRPLLEYADSLAGVKVAHTLESQVRSHNAFLKEANEIRVAGFVGRTSSLAFWRRLAFSAGVFLTLIFVIGAGLVYASQSALPGDRLYSTKRGIEDLRLSIAGDTVLFESLSARFEEERIEEISNLIEAGSSATDLSFSGLLTEIDGSNWIVAGLPLRISESAMIVGEPQVGQLLEVLAFLEDGVLIAVEVTSPFASEETPETQLDRRPGNQEGLFNPDDDQPMATATSKSGTEGIIATPPAAASTNPAPSPTATTEATPTAIRDAGDDGGEENNSEDDDHDNESEDSEDGNENENISDDSDSDSGNSNEDESSGDGNESNNNESDSNDSDDEPEDNENDSNDNDDEESNDNESDSNDSDDESEDNENDSNDNESEDD